VCVCVCVSGKKESVGESVSKVMGIIVIAGAHLLYWHQSTCLLVPKYLLTGTKVQMLTPEEQISTDRRCSLALLVPNRASIEP
jgi:hypothetical protein